MRTIDADALQEVFRKKCQTVCSCCSYFEPETLSCGLIDNAPTIEETKGKWSEHEDYCGDTYYTCSNCGGDWCTIEGTPVDNMMNFCPNCGARMESDV